jgi:hypothetical protein
MLQLPNDEAGRIHVNLPITDFSGPEPLGDPDRGQAPRGCDDVARSQLNKNKQPFFRF